MHKVLTYVTLIAILALPVTAEIDAEKLVELTDFKGGVVMLLEPENIAPVATLKKLVPNSMIHVCVKNQDQVDAHRKYLYKAGLADTVTVSTWDGKGLPVVSDFVNVLAADAKTSVARSEIVRALAPLGKAVIGTDVVTKPRPAEMDEWPQYLYDAAGTSVSKDTLLRPPLFHSQWTGGPRWSRHHDVMSSVSACVSGDSKVFYIFDEGNTFSPLLPSSWKLIARDAFNGTILWKRDIDTWIPNMLGLKSGPSNIPRRLVVNGKRIYVTLGVGAPVSVLDTTTGATVKVLSGTKDTEEIVYDRGKLYLVADHLEAKPELAAPPRYSSRNWIQREKEIICYDLDSDKIDWRKTQNWVAPLSLVLHRSKLYFFDGKRVIALDKTTADQLWTSEEMEVPKVMVTEYAPKLIVQGGMVLFSGSGAGKRGELTGISTEDGRTAWKAPNPASGYKSPEDLFVIDGKAWAGDVTNHRWSNNESDATGEFTGVNVASGNVDESFPHVEAYWFHHRCHPGKATENYIILNRSGTEFVNPRTGEWTLHHWTRGACLYGVMPANGMLYSPQHPCACYIGAKTYGFTVLSPKNDQHPTTRETPDAQRLTTVKKQPLAKVPVAKKNEWPTYRGNVKRSGALAGIAPPTHQEWSLELGGELSPPVIAENKVFVSQKDRNALVAVNAATGKVAWEFLPGGKIDSPPAIYKKRVYCGSADGFIYCLDVNDGSLIWKYQGAPTPTKHMWFEKIEATHPVHGNVLVMNDKVYTLAGRNMYTDGGLRFLILDAATGRKLSENAMDDRMPGTDDQMQMHHEFLNMPMALTDLLSTNGKKIFMRYQQFDMNGKRIKLDFTRKLYGTNKADINESAKGALTDQTGEDAHLFAGTGFLDDSWWHRTYWVYGKNYASGWPGYYVAGKGGAPAGRMITFNDDNIFTWGRIRRYFKWSKVYEYRLYAQDYDYNETWEARIPILARSMLLSDKTLFILGPDELARQEQVNKGITTPEMQKTVQKQHEAFMGKHGSKLIVVDIAGGSIRAGAEMDSVPVFDGMAGAYGKIYVAMADGTLRCLGASGDKLQMLPTEAISAYNADSEVPKQAPKKKAAPKKKPGANKRPGNKKKA